MSTTAKEEDRASDNSDTVQTTGASHTTHANILGRSSRGYTFEACVIEGVRVRCGVGEVDVLAMAVVEVVVLARSRVGDRGSRDLGDSGGTCLSLHEFP